MDCGRRIRPRSVRFVVPSRGSIGRRLRAAHLGFRPARRADHHLRFLRIHLRTVSINEIHAEPHLLHRVAGHGGVFAARRFPVGRFSGQSGEADRFLCANHNFHSSRFRSPDYVNAS